MNVRVGEVDKTWFRSERFQCVNNRWYFLTREGSQEGPFDNRREAEQELLLYLRHANDALFQHAH